MSVPKPFCRVANSVEAPSASVACHWALRRQVITAAPGEARCSAGACFRSCAWWRFVEAMAEDTAHQNDRFFSGGGSSAPHAREGPQENLLSIADLVTPALTKQYSNVRITTLFPWQSAALQLPDVLYGRSHLIYTASTSAGKTLVAEILLLRRLAEAGKGAKALFVLPLRALVAQKAASFAKLLEGTGLSSAGD